MKLAEALNERKSLKTKLTNLRERLVANARVQEGDQPAEQPVALLGEVADSVAKLESLIVRINRTNLEAKLPDDAKMTLMEAIARRDILNLRYEVLKQLVGAASTTQNRWAVTRSEIKFRTTVNVADLQKDADALAKEIRQLDTRLQAANWQIDLAE